jgi:hypothetical protein
MSHTGDCSLMAGVVAVLATGAAAAFAAAPVHVKRTFGPIAVDIPAGSLCDFAYHEEAQGNLVGVEDQLDVSIPHRNADTGQTLTENLHYAPHVDFITGQVQVTGQSWHLRTENGQLVLSGAGLVATDLLTGDILTRTPHAMADTAAVICPALAGSPAT